MVKTVKEAYGEIVRLRNEFYQKWEENDEPSGHNRTVLKAKYEAFDKALELLTPSIVDSQPEDSDKFTHSVTKKSDQEESISEDLLDEIHNRWEDDPHIKWPKCPYKDFKNIACHFANWQKQQMIKSAKLSGWVARDENGSLHLFEVEPSRIMHRWWDRDYHSTTLDNKDFPDLEWENEPVYVKLAIIKEDGI
jgi:hypothetical protein